ncbi:hypothetical protein BDD12DRAFT_802931 [Trichophaea hybrida]|nr:hypothetical protein BDD12DRAFT_802931 [Trichophaea hybrida]
MGKILSKADAFMNKSRDIHNYEDYTVANKDTAERNSETEPRSSLGYWRLSSMMTPMSIHGSLYKKAKYTQADSANSSCDAEEDSSADANLQRKLKGKGSGSNNHSIQITMYIK